MCDESEPAAQAASSPTRTAPLRPSGAMSDYAWESRPAAPETDAAEELRGDAAEKAAPFKAGCASSQPFSKYPEHLAAPPPATIKSANNDEAKLHSRAWVQTASSRSDATRSIVRMNIR